MKYATPRYLENASDPIVTPSLTRQYIAIMRQVRSGKRFDRDYGLSWDWIYYELAANGTNVVRFQLAFPWRTAALWFAKQASRIWSAPSSRAPGRSAALPPREENPFPPSRICSNVSLLLFRSTPANGSSLSESFIIARRVSPPGSRHKGILSTYPRSRGKILLMRLLVCVSRHPENDDAGFHVYSSNLKFCRSQRRRMSRLKV